MNAAEEPQRCGAIDEPAYGVWFECGLPPGHAGDHEDIHYWTNEPHGPARPPRPGSGPTQWLSDAYAQVNTQLVELALRGSPLVNRNKVMRTVRRDGT